MYVTSNGYRIYYEVVGDGQPLLLVPGLLSSVKDYHKYGYIDALRDRFRVITMDTLGHGESDKPSDSSAYTRDMVTSHLIAVLDAEHIERAHVWGYSRGGGITATVATAYPERMLSILVGGATVAPVLPEAMRASAAERSVQRDKERIAALRASDWSAFWAAQGIVDDKEVIEAFTGDNDAQAIAAAIQGWGPPGPGQYDLSPLTGRILTYAGSNDLGLQVAGALENYAAGCKALGARLEVLEGLDHPRCFFRGDLALPIALDFLAGVTTK